MKPKTLILMFVAVGCGLAASYMTSRYLAAQSGPERPPDEEVRVLVTKSKMNAFTVIAEPADYFEVKSVRKSDAPKDVIGDLTRIKGRMLKSNMSEGKWVAESDLMPIGTEPLYTKLKEGERMFTLKVDNVTGTSGFILPGSKVDVVSTLQKGNGEVTGPYSKTILQDVEVLAVDQQPQLPDGTVSKLADRVTLRVALEQAEKLSVFAETGKIRLIVRRPDDTRLVETVGASTIEKARGNQRGGVDGGEGSASRSNPLSILPKFLDPFGRDEKKQDGGAEPPKSAPNPLNPLIPLDPNPAPPVVHAPKIHQMRIINGTRSEVVEFSMSEEQDKRRSRDRGGKQQPKGDAAQERPLLDL